MSLLPQELLESAVKMKIGKAAYSVEDLNRYVGQVILALAEGYDILGRTQVADAIKSVAKAECEKDHGKTAVSWVDYAEKYGKDTPAQNEFCIQALNQLSLERS
tara:strand:+ start:823 stop:1134 length:312 start_codon:yes stop_codon:yes gene_type:complete